MRIADFGLFLLKSASVFAMGSFSCDGKHSSARGTFEPKSPLALPYNPIIWPKTFFLVYKNTLQIFSGFCQKADLTYGQDMTTPSQN